MEADDVLAHNVVLRGPTESELSLGSIVVEAIAHSRHVIQQRVEPHVGHVALVERDLDAPVKARTAHGKVVEAAFDKAAHLVHAERRLDKVRVLVIELEQLVLEGGKLKEVGLLLQSSSTMLLSVVLMWVARVR